MKYFSVLFLFFFPFDLLGQAEIDWLTYYGVQNDAFSPTNPSQVMYDSINNYVYVAGVTSDLLGISTPGTHQEAPYYDEEDYFSNDIFLSKWDTAGNLIWGTYYGGAAEDKICNMALDADGNIIISGFSQGHANITTPGSFQEFSVSEPGSTNPDNFISKFSPDGVLLWGTYFGLGGNSLYSGLVIDPATNDIYVAGSATNEGLGTVGTFQPELFGGDIDGFIAKFNSEGNRIWCTYLGGENVDYIYNITLSSEGYLYISGGTRSATNIASPGAEIETRDDDVYNIGFLSKFDTSGNRLWSTYLGGNGTIEWFFDIKTTNDASTGQENIFVYGRTNSTNHSTAGTFGSVYGGGTWDMVLLKYNELGYKQWGTYIGGNGNESTYLNGQNTLFGFTNSMMVNGVYGNEEVQIVGGTQSTNFYFDTECSYIPLTGNYKGYIASLDTTGNLNWSMPFDEGINSVSSFGHNKFYATGLTDIDGLATIGAYKETKEAGSVSGFIAKLNFDQCLTTEFSISMIDNILYAPSGFSNYQWTMNGTVIEDETSEFLDISAFEPAVYTVRFQDDCVCNYMSAEYITELMVVNNPDEGNPILLYPNPASDFIILKNLNDRTQLSVYNLLGQLVLEKVSGTTQETISISHLSSGMYVIKLSADENKVIFLKFTKK